MKLRVSGGSITTILSNTAEYLVMNRIVINIIIIIIMIMMMIVIIALCDVIFEVTVFVVIFLSLTLFSPLPRYTSLPYLVSVVITNFVLPSFICKYPLPIAKDIT